MTALRSRVESPLGPIALLVENGRLSALDFIGSDEDRVPALRGAGDRDWTSGPCGAIGERVAAYFAGELDALDAIPIAPAGTPFQLRVWQALRGIPLGQTRSYLQVAVEIGDRAATRAVGAANGKNPISLVVPCHRVIASNGTLHGYGGGLWRKEWLLRHEGALPRGLFEAERPTL